MPWWVRCSVTYDRDGVFRDHRQGRRLALRRPAGDLVAARLPAVPVPKVRGLRDPEVATAGSSVYEHYERDAYPAWFRRLEDRLRLRR